MDRAVVKVKVRHPKLSRNSGVLCLHCGSRRGIAAKRIRVRVRVGAGVALLQKHHDQQQNLSLIKVEAQESA